MKNLILIFVLGFIPLSLFAQPQDVASIFEKYKDRPGFTNVDITDPSTMFGDMMDKSDDKDGNSLMKGINGIKILTAEKSKDKSEKDVKEFNEDLKRITTTADYKQFMSVSDANSYVKMYVRKTGDDVTEFLLISIDDGESTLLWINGSMKMKDLGKIGNMLNNKPKHPKKQKSDEEKKGE